MVTMAARSRLAEESPPRATQGTREPGRQAGTRKAPNKGPRGACPVPWPHPERSVQPCRPSWQSRRVAGLGESAGEHPKCRSHARGGQLLRRGSCLLPLGVATCEAPALGLVGGSHGQWRHARQVADRCMAGRPEQQPGPHRGQARRDLRRVVGCPRLPRSGLHDRQADGRRDQVRGEGCMCQPVVAEKTSPASCCGPGQVSRHTRAPGQSVPPISSGPLGQCAPSRPGAARWREGCKPSSGRGAERPLAGALGGAPWRLASRPPLARARHRLWTGARCERTAVGTRIRVATASPVRGASRSLPARATSWLHASAKPACPGSPRLPPPRPRRFVHWPPGRPLAV